MKNPVIVAREGLGLNRPQFASRLGIHYLTITKYELGYVCTFAPRVKAAMAALGIDGEQLQRDYQAWRGEQNVTAA